MKKALIVWGGWDGHEPDKVADLFEEMLGAEGFEVQKENSLDPLTDAELMNGLSLFVPVWTMGEITYEQAMGACRAVSEHGVGIAGSHGGMCDAFRGSTEWQFMTGGQWVAHPGDDGVTYHIEMNPNEPHEITDRIADFKVTSEQYYLHVDPGVKVLATCRFPAAGVDGPHTENPCDMPTIWTKMFGKGRVFYTALGHKREVLEIPESKEITRRGLLWAAK